MMTKYRVMTPKRRFAPRLVSRVADALNVWSLRLEGLLRVDAMMPVHQYVVVVAISQLLNGLPHFLACLEILVLICIKSADWITTGKSHLTSSSQ
jgi:hypothetical protein